MKHLGAYKEFNPDMDFPSIKESFLPAPYEGMDKVIKYLEDGTVTFVSIGRARDVFTGEEIAVERCGMTDGEYTWPSYLPYYVRNYNLKLSRDFENKILNKNTISQ